MLSQLPFTARYNPWLGDLCFEAGCSRHSPAGWSTLGDSVPAVPGQAASFTEAALLPTLLSQPVHTAFDLRASKLAVQQGHHGRVEGTAASLRDRRGVVRSRRDEMWHVLPACCPWMQEKKQATMVSQPRWRVPPMVHHPVIKTCACRAREALNKIASLHTQLTRLPSARSASPAWDNWLWAVTPCWAGRGLSEMKGNVLPD